MERPLEKDEVQIGEFMTTASAALVTLSKLVDREEVAESTIAFTFYRPSNWTFKAGQFLDLTLLAPSETGTEGNTRSFSIASAPHEDTLMVATRMRDTAFKRALRAMPLGSGVKLEGPSGNLTLHSDVSRTAVFLAGGIGITPFRSIVLQAAKDKRAHRIFLFYSNRRPEDAPFLDELQALEQENPNYKLIATMTDMAKSHRSWRGEAGLIDKEMLANYLKDAVSPIYYVAGPPEMVKGVRAVIHDIGVDDADICAEEFSGY